MIEVSQKDEEYFPKPPETGERDRRGKMKEKPGVLNQTGKTGGNIHSRKKKINEIEEREKKYEQSKINNKIKTQTTRKTGKEKQKNQTKTISL